VKLNAETLEEIAHFEAFTKPVRNPELSDYFTKLTGITNVTLSDKGVSFERGYAGFLEFCGGSAPWAYGPDATILSENIELNDLGRCFEPSTGQNIKPWLTSTGLDLAGINSGKLAQFLGADWQGREHDGVDDARSVAAGIRVLQARGLGNPFWSKNTQKTP